MPFWTCWSCLSGRVGVAFLDVADTGRKAQSEGGEDGLHYDSLRYCRVWWRGLAENCRTLFMRTDRESAKDFCALEYMLHCANASEHSMLFRRDETKILLAKNIMKCSAKSSFMNAKKDKSTVQITIL